MATSKTQVKRSGAKKRYARPQLVKHGGVEKLTAWRWNNRPKPTGPVG